MVHDIHSSAISCLIAGDEIRWEANGKSCWKMAQFEIVKLTRYSRDVPEDIADVSSRIDIPTRRFCMHNEPQRQWLHADLAGCAAIFAMIEYGKTDETNYSR